MNDNVVKSFLNDRENIIPGTIPYILSTLINRGGKWYCIVEGKTDKYFYSNINKVDLKTRTYYLFGKNNSIENGGKETVISSYNKIKHLPNLNKYMNKFIFIIDHDYAGLTSEKQYIDYESYNCFTITKPYSFENYFLTEDNIKILFDYLGIKNSVYDFIEQYNQFADEIKEYTRLKSSTIEINQRQSRYYEPFCQPYRKIHSYDEIFSFSFENGRYKFNKNFLNDEVNNMRRFISRNPSAKSFYNNESEDLVKNNDFVRGHNAFDFLSKYLLDVHGITLIQGDNNQYMDIVKRLNVDIDLKNAQGLLIS